MKGLLNWVSNHANSPSGSYILSLLTFTEGFLPIPTSSLLAFYCLHNRNKSLFYALLVTISSFVASLIGYGIGYFFGNTEIFQYSLSYIISKEPLEWIAQNYQNYQTWAILIGSLLPFPFKFLTLTAGFFKIPFIPFLILTFIGRGIRFYAIAISIYIWGDEVTHFLNKYFYYIINFIRALLYLYCFITILKY